ncbi:uncharacterized protein LOC133791376 [Humulus lupulus]|uniref:uncharacterized protein LOC133791376 n=1 Tax=Humulus lupulus TaxID=3486 RepID=UPI002B408B2A|nr:uncharacterized protein LOC133791376 [Humulus lupulus]
MSNQASGQQLTITERPQDQLAGQQLTPTTNGIGGSIPGGSTQTHGPPPIVDNPMTNEQMPTAPIGDNPMSSTPGGPPKTFDPTLPTAGRSTTLTPEEIIEQLVAKKLEGMEARIHRIPRVPAPIRKSLPSSFADSPFVDAIALVEMPKKFVFPLMKMYDGTTDPNDHIASYKQRMFTGAIPRELREACMCKGFGSSLVGPALQWYTNLPNNSIFSFAQLTDIFVEQFACSRKLEKLSDDLYRIKQRRGESLRDYVARFNTEKVSITSCNIDTAITTFRKGLMVDSDLYKELTKYPCRTMEDVLAKAWAQIKWEEDESNKPTYSPYPNTRESRSTRRIERRYSPYCELQPTTRTSRPGREPRHTLPSTRPREQEKTPIPEYNLNIDSVEIVAVMKGMGNKVKWPEKIKKPADKRDTTKWCEFHNDHVHTTVECIALRFEVAGLLRRGQLRDFLSDKGKITMTRGDTRPTTPPEPPQHTRTCNVISGGSEVSGVTYSAAKRHAREVSGMDGRPKRPPTNYTGQTISFVNDEASDLLNPHHDALVISLFISNCLAKRILIDNGSSANILFLHALRGMWIDESTVIRKSTVLVGLSGEQKHSVGEVTLYVYAKGVNLQTKFLVVDSPSAYNTILGRPWIHAMKAVPSTYHQVICFPTKWGVKEICGAQKMARDCYQTTLKDK